ncbi:cAMP-binding domain of CRP or a regulatory subunit of cAMP-dependent protein kinases [Tenacibaculum sp. MAR_2009_124]|uniref:Crp/Fnr family transcriptional regulator n=1 Tax=Tenacibaculum sp. MAR_2009_124 TaxID=1250059 RepID=UPI00089DA123|nr:Crp/Fnr family transcriptional regulator [Tenacibaculum sp. MAR_2009_124]SEB80205.1 cAMP-binding domain of CRP or a regulatory subunit of cAMP-dependent protein kinases [Tenacibaculum sp. MAR_2009_124]
MDTFNSVIKEYFGALTLDELNLLRSFFEEEKFSKNDFFSKSNGYCNRLSLVKSGLLRIYTLADGKEITQWISSSNYFVTDISGFFFNEPNRWTIQALTDVELLTLNKQNYSKLCNEFPKWNKVERNFMAKCFGVLENRVFSHLSMTAEQRYDQYFEQNKDLFNQVPLQYLASILGMTPETFSRIRKRKF